jgi:hypothetical protein
MTWQDSSPDLITRYAVLAAVKAASRRVRRWPAASLDRCSARRTVVVQAGTEKRLSNRTKKAFGWDMAEFGQWKFTVNRDETEFAFSKIELGGADSCLCATCRNFSRARTRVFPVEFLMLLEQLGIDPRKEVEVYPFSSSIPGFRGTAGWFHFHGTLEETGDFSPVDYGDGFTAWMCRAGAPRHPIFEYLPAVQLEFRAKLVPWLLDEPEPN